ncbi:hypothetical protein C8F04DRAFT_1187324 [Mycena alexandri]|uniref:F-box domain-containing protein n=1 Tax=Mycena alexandri TaxID=1745969 RepID=A0AAD6WYC8_9AGAR|nr:hypothetical protein C8F04DRAFT_1187324 [Mycena alexandri]
MHASLPVYLVSWLLCGELGSAARLLACLFFAVAVSASSLSSVEGNFHALGSSVFGTLAAFPKNWVHIFINCLPIEVIVEILAFACGSYHRSRASFLRTRRKLASTCILWRLLVDAFPQFWTAFTVTPHQLVSVIDSWTSHWHARILDLVVKCDDLYSLHYPRALKSAPRMVPSRTIAVVAPYFSRCSRLRLVLDMHHALPDVLERLRRAGAYYLRTFSLTGTTLPFVTTPPPRVVFKPKCLFRTGIPGLQCLKLDNTTVGWPDARFYPELHDLILLNLVFAIAPRTIQLYRALCRAAHLRWLCVQLVQCDDLLPLPIAPILLPDLRVVVLHLDGSVGVACVLSMCVMRSLETLTVGLDTNAEVLLLLKCASAMESVTNLSVNGTASNPALVAALYHHFPHLRILDLSRATPVYFAALRGVEDVGPMFFSHLEELSVLGIQLDSLRRLLVERSTAFPPLRRLVAYRVDDWSEDDNLPWFYSYFNDNFLVDPDPTFAGSWFDNI